MKPPALWLSLFGLSSVFIIVFTVFIYHSKTYYPKNTSQNKLEPSPVPEISDTWQTYISQNDTSINFEPDNFTLEYPGYFSQTYSSGINGESVIFYTDGFNLSISQIKSQFGQNTPTPPSDWVYEEHTFITKTESELNLFFSFADKPEWHNLKTQILSSFKFADDYTPTGTFCGGIAGLPCPSGFTCQLDGNYPDAGGTCIKNLSCKTGGCSNELCVNSASPDVASICIYQDDYACLKYSVCELQSDGTCGWTNTPKYTTCLANPPPLD